MLHDMISNLNGMRILTGMIQPMTEPMSSQPCMTVDMKDGLQKIRVGMLNLEMHSKNTSLRQITV